MPGPHDAKLVKGTTKRDAPIVGKVFTIGYEGRNVDDLVHKLIANGIEQIIDVRQNAFSRKPGFSKTMLFANLQKNGISYHHIPELGSPRDIRQRHNESGSAAAFMDEYSAYLDTRPEAYQRLKGLALSRTSALLCFERDHTDCHRSILSERLSGDGFQVVHI